jgi:hypothetical protein
MENGPSAKKDGRQTAEQQTHGSSIVGPRNLSHRSLSVNGEIRRRRRRGERRNGHRGNQNGIVV